MSREKAIAQIEFEIQQIDELLSSYKDLFEKAKDAEPTLIELTAMGSVLHSFYNGIENVFKTIGKFFDGEIPNGLHWHSQLIKQMVTETNQRDPVISDPLKDRLVEYLAFRHFYRHSYSFVLKWDELKRLSDPLVTVWSDAKMELRRFMERQT